MKKCITLTVSGKVQGVFFRASTKERADELSIKGFVRNEPDGSVYIEAEGEEKIMDQFIEWCKQGPPLANVTECIINVTEVKNFSQFEIKR